LKVNKISNTLELDVGEYGWISQISLKLEENKNTTSLKNATVSLLDAQRNFVFHGQISSDKKEYNLDFSNKSSDKDIYIAPSPQPIIPSTCPQPSQTTYIEDKTYTIQSKEEPLYVPTTTPSNDTVVAPTPTPSNDTVFAPTLTPSNDTVAAPTSTPSNDTVFAPTPTPSNDTVFAPTPTPSNDTVFAPTPTPSNDTVFAPVLTHCPSVECPIVKPCPVCEEKVCPECPECPECQQNTKSIRNEIPWWVWLLVAIIGVIVTWFVYNHFVKKRLTIKKAPTPQNWIQPPQKVLQTFPQQFRNIGFAPNNFSLNKQNPPNVLLNSTSNNMTTNPRSTPNMYTPQYLPSPIPRVPLNRV